MRGTIPVLAGTFMIALAGMADGAAAEDGDPARGSQVFNTCAMCHTLSEGKHRIGPNLKGVIGRRAGSAEGFRYSEAMREAGFEWTPEKLDAYLADGASVVPGNRMPFPGLFDPEDRADVIAFLKDVSKQ
jgi:cytochrome c